MADLIPDADNERTSALLRTLEEAATAEVAAQLARSAIKAALPPGTRVAFRVGPWRQPKTERATVRYVNESGVYVTVEMDGGRGSRIVCSSDFLEIHGGCILKGGDHG